MKITWHVWEANWPSCFCKRLSRLFPIPYLFQTDSPQKNTSSDSSCICCRRGQLQITAGITEWDWIQFGHCRFSGFRLFIWRNAPGRSQSWEIKGVEGWWLCWTSPIKHLTLVPSLYNRDTAWYFGATAEALGQPCYQGHLQYLLIPCPRSSPGFMLIFALYQDQFHFEF